MSGSAHSIFGIAGQPIGRRQDVKAVSGIAVNSISAVHVAEILFDYIGSSRQGRQRQAAVLAIFGPDPDQHVWRNYHPAAARLQQNRGREFNVGGFQGLKDTAVYIGAAG